MQSQTAKKPRFQFRANLGVKLIAIAFATLIIIFSISIIQSQQTILSNLRSNAEKELKSAAEIMKKEIDGDKDAAVMVALSVAQRPDVQKLAAEKNKQGLENLLNPLFNQLRDQYKIVHFNIIDERGVIISRLNIPEKFDDYVFYNALVTNTINTRRPTGGFEVDTGGLSMRGTAPLFYEEKFIGLIEVGIDYSQDFANQMKKATKADFLIWFYNPSTSRFGVEFAGEGVASPNPDFIYYAGTKREGIETQSKNLEEAFASFKNILAFDLDNNRAQASLMIPILGPDATFFGVTEITADYTERLASETRANIATQLGIIGVSLLGLLAIGIAVNFLAVSPLNKITNFAQEITGGASASQLNLKTGDEFEQVAGALNKMAGAIAEKREDLKRQVDQRTAQLLASNEVAKVASSILDPDELISRVIQLITDNFGYYYAAIFLLSEDGRWAELKDATGAAGEALKARRHRLQVGGNSMVGAVLSAKEARIALDVGETAVRFNNPLLPNTRSEIALPLMVADNVLGALDVQSVREADFNAEDISTLQNMVSQVAVALENARLFREMNESLEELRQSNSEFVTSSWRDQLKSGKLEYISNPNLAFINENDEFKEIEIPLNLREQRIGQIALEISQDWDAEDQSWVESLATQVAISLENSRLLEESQQAALRERLSASIIQKVWAANNVDTIIQTAVRELARSLDASEVKIELKAD
ncbi:MAG: GAF domain-containing protein [Anaerolineales bacterium]|jgi:GAF domain-containing protein/HAMP domain-containing protein|nr:GAF domain-containing protein [Anaerolineales bacterium]